MCKSGGQVEEPVEPLGQDTMHLSPKPAEAGQPSTAQAKAGRAGELIGTVHPHDDRITPNFGPLPPACRGRGRVGRAAVTAGRAGLGRTSGYTGA